MAALILIFVFFCIIYMFNGDGMNSKQQQKNLEELQKRWSEESENRKQTNNNVQKPMFYSNAGNAPEEKNKQDELFPYDDYEDPLQLYDDYKDCFIDEYEARDFWENRR